MSARVAQSTLTPDSAGFRSRALRRATLSVTSPERAGGAVRLAPATGHAQLELVAEGAAPVAGELISGVVIYRDAFPDTDVVHAAHGSRFEELRVLHSPKAPTTARYRLKSAGTLRANRGTIEVVDAQGRVQLRSLPAYAIDAAGKRRALDVQLDTSGSEPVMIAKLDTAGLSYPITVDPTWVSGGAGAWPSEALVALNSIWIEGGVTTTGSAAVIDAAPGAVLADSAELVVALGATLTGTAKANRVRVRLGGTIAGDVFTNALTNNGTVTGTTHTPLALPLALTVPDQPSVSPGSADVTLAPHQDLTLAAGAYRNASLGLGTTADPTVLTLSGGVYHFASLDLGAASRLECSQPCDVRVQGKLGPGLGSFIGPAAGSGLAPADVQLFVAGLNGLTGTLGALPKAAAIGVGSTLHARVHVPNGTLWVRAGTAVTGTLIAKDLQLGLGASVTKDATGTCGPTDDGNPCTADSCDTATGTVHHDPVPAGTGCDDATVCNGHESCDGAGTCQAGTPIAVDDGNECTADSCDPQAGAQHAPLTGTACDDESACTQTDTCQAGTCTGTNPVSCAPLDQCHDAGTCNPTTGACTNPPKADGIACNDGSACTQTDACQAGTCTGTNPVSCAPLDQCHDAGICNPTTGACTNPPKADGASCDDENPCTTGEACSAGSCGGGSPTPVSDGNPCTADACSPTGGVTHTPVTAGTACSDADLCNGDEICNASGTCQPGTPVATSDGNPCTLDQCDPPTGSVTHPAAPAGTPCNADACTIGALCDAGGACQGGTPVLVDDGDPCTVDTCDPMTGPAFTTCSTVDRTVSTHIAGSLAWLYTGANPVQTGVAPGTITVARAAALRGEVRDRAGNPLPGVTVRIEGRPELGQTTTHSNGGFDMVVNGGGELRLVLQKSGFLPVERTVPVAWGEHASVPPVVMTKLDAAVTPVSFAGAPSMQVARGTAQTDANGSRQATLLIAGGTTAALIASDGTPTPVTALHLRATEYTVGAAGPKAMPAPLPPTSQYTYAVELSADEAIAVGAARVELSQPAVFYVDNFLALPAGETVPVGAYDRALGKWVAEQSGVVLRVLSVSGGVAAVDATGDGLADTPTELAARGITSDELATLGQLYVTGQSVWRVSLAHFTPIDCNFPAKPPSAPPPPQPKWPTDDNDDSCLAQGSKLECENQILQEEVPLAGTPYHLVYSSDRTPGRLSSSTVPIVLSGASVPSDLKRIDVEIVVAGQVTRQSFPPLPNQTHVYQWDGRDGFGRLVQGRQHATVTLDWVFDVVYEKGSTFGDYGTGVTLDYNAARAEISARRVFGGPIGPWDAKPMGLGGWTLSEHHAYDPVGGVLYMGDGSRRSAAAVPAVLEKVVDLAASSPWLGQLLASDAVAEADGGMFVADESQSVVWRISATGSATVYAGTLNQGGHSGDGGPATSAVLNRPHKLALAPDGSLFIVDTSSYVVRKVSSGGMISTVAGIPNQPGFTGDGGLATSAKLQPVAVAIGPDGLLYIGESRGIRRVGADGIIRTIAGNGSTCCTVDEVPATSSALNVWDLAFGPTGSLYVADAANYQLRWIDGAGIIHSLGGTACPVASCDGEDGTPLQASGGITPSAVQPLADGTVLFVDRRSPMRLRAVAPDGILHSLAGGGASAFAQGLPARQAALILNEVALASDGRVLLPLHNYQPRVVVLRVNPPLPGLTGNGLAVASGQGSEVYVFDASGRHLSTRDTRTGATRMSFAYSSAGRLASLTDANGNITTIQHDAGGNPIAIVGPYGHQTVLGVDANGFLTTITDPLSATVTSSYTPAGLMTAFTDARSHTSTMTYDALGRVSTDANAASGSVSFLRTTGFDAFTVNKSTALGRTTTYDVDFLTTGGALRTNTFPDGTVSTLLRALDGKEVVTAADGTIYSRTNAPDPRLGLQAPVTSRTTRTPGGLLRTETVTRTVTGAVPADPLAFTQQTDTVDVNGRPTTTVFDKATLKTTVTSAQGRVTKTFHDTQMRVTRREVTGIAPVDFVYDSRGRLATVTQGPRVRSTGYYSTGDGRNGYVQSVTNALSQTTAFTPDAVGRILQQLDPDSALTSFGWDGNGNLTGVTPPGQPAHGQTFTPVDLLAAYTPPVVPGVPAPATLFTYNVDRQLTQTTRPDALLVGRTYDSAGKLDLLTTPTGNVDYDYFGLTPCPTCAPGRLQKITDPSGVVLDHAYDGMLLKTLTWSGAVAGSVSFGHDSSFRVTSETVTVGATTSPVAFGYDNDDILICASPSTCSPAGTDALKITLNAGNGLVTGSTHGVVTDTLTYNAFGELASYTGKVGASNVFSEVVDTASNPRDALGRIVQRVETNGGAAITWRYTYDLRGRLVDVQKDGALHEHYDHDGNGNRTLLTTSTGTTAGVYDAQDRLLSYGATTYTYTANGELRTKTDTGGTTTYTYDVRGNLVQVDLPGGDVIQYLVDGQDRRVGKKKNGVLERGWLYRNQLNPVAELDGAGNLVSRFVYGSRSNVPEYVVRGGVTYRVLPDHLGSPRAAVDVATGTAAWRADFDAWGNRTLIAGAADFVPFGFAGGMFDHETGLTRFGARDYDPVVGRWMSKDPRRFGGGNNLYEYANSEPVNWFDFDGRTPLTCVASLFKCVLYCVTSKGQSPNCSINCGNALATCWPELPDPEPPEPEPTEYENCASGVKSSCSGEDAGVGPCADVEGLIRDTCGYGDPSKNICEQP